jgi:hypothetical protein
MLEETEVNHKKETKNQDGITDKIEVWHFPAELEGFISSAKRFDEGFEQRT